MNINKIINSKRSLEMNDKVVWDVNLNDVSGDKGISEDVVVELTITDVEMKDARTGSKGVLLKFDKPPFRYWITYADRNNNWYKLGRSQLKTIMEANGEKTMLNPIKLKGKIAYAYLLPDLYIDEGGQDHFIWSLGAFVNSKDAKKPKMRDTGYKKHMQDLASKAGHDKDDIPF